MGHLIKAKNFEGIGSSRSARKKNPWWGFADFRQKFPQIFQIFVLQIISLILGFWGWFSGSGQLVLGFWTCALEVIGS